MRRMKSLNIATILMKEVNPSGDERHPKFFSWVTLKRLMTRMQSLKIATILMKEVNPSVEAVESPAEFENIEHFKEGSKSLVSF